MLITRNNTNSKKLIIAVSTPEGIGFSYSVFTLAAAFAGDFFAAGFFVFAFEVELAAEVFFFASETIHSA